MHGVIKVIMLMVLIGYMVSPVDLYPGPVDDLIMLLIYAANQKRLSSGEE